MNPSEYKDLIDEYFDHMLHLALFGEVLERGTIQELDRDMIDWEDLTPPCDSIGCGNPRSKPTVWKHVHGGTIECQFEGTNWLKCEECIKSMNTCKHCYTDARHLPI